MRVPQSRQRPRSSSQESTGTLSYGRTGVAHAGHAERGLTSEPPRGRRWATTFRNEPSRRPAKPARTNGAAKVIAPKRDGATDGRPGGRPRRRLLERGRALNAARRAEARLAEKRPGEASGLPVVAVGGGALAATLTARTAVTGDDAGGGLRDREVVTRHGAADIRLGLRARRHGVLAGGRGGDLDLAGAGAGAEARGAEAVRDAG